MYGQPRGGIQHRRFRTRTKMLKHCTCQAHRDAFFYANKKRKGSSVPRPRVFGSDGESAGGNGREVTLWLPRPDCLHKTTCNTHNHTNSRHVTCSSYHESNYATETRHLGIAAAHRDDLMTEFCIPLIYHPFSSSI